MFSGPCVIIYFNLERFPLYEGTAYTLWSMYTNYKRTHLKGAA
jgi:hypothetical protein